MTLELIQEVGILWKKKESAEEIDSLISRGTAALDEAIKRGHARSICKCSRSLADEVDHEWSHPGLWSEDRVHDVYLLLQKAAEATVGTEFEENCAARPEEFMRRLEALKRAKEALRRVCEVVESSP